jgi:hypothetical protein
VWPLPCAAPGDAGTWDAGAVAGGPDTASTVEGVVAGASGASGWAGWSGPTVIGVVPAHPVRNNPAKRIVILVMSDLAL